MHPGLATDSVPTDYVFEPFTKEEEQELFRRYKEDNDRLAGEQLVLSVSRLVRSLVKMNLPKGLYGDVESNLFDDILSDCYYALARCLDAFDHTRGMRFSTYVYQAVMNKIRTFVSNRIRDTLRTNCAGNVLHSGNSKHVSARRERDKKTAISEDEQSMYHKIDRKEDLSVLSAMLEKDMAILQPRTRRAFHLHYIEGMTKKQIGDLFGVSKGRVEQIIQAGARTIRESTFHHNQYVQTIAN
jgi:RNA polymerase sigma factor (sigma-70 family)